MNKIKEVLKHKTIIETIKLAALAIVIYLIGWIAFTYIPFLNQYKIYAIQTDSMNPIINSGDIVIIREIQPDEVQEGDITAFYVDITNDGEDDVIVHYIDEVIQHNEDTLIYRSKAAVSDFQDPWTLEEHDIIGTYVRHIESIGKILLFLQSWIGKVVLLVDIIIISIFYDMIVKKKAPKQKSTST